VLECLAKQFDSVDHFILGEIARFEPVDDDQEDSE
jgi:hypothetical protein